MVMFMVILGRPISWVMKAERYVSFSRNGLGDCAGAGVDMQLFVDVPEVDVGGVDAQPEFGGDFFFVRPHHRFEDFALTGGSVG